MLSVRSATSSAEVSKLTTMALSCSGRTVPSMNAMAASCWKWKRSRMLLLVSIRIARRSGRSDSAANSMMVCGFLLSKTSKSSLVRSVTKRPFLSETVNSMLTRETSRVMRVLSPESGGAVLSLFLAGWLDWPESRSENEATARRRYSFFMTSDFIIRRRSIRGDRNEDARVRARGDRQHSGRYARIRGERGGQLHVDLR